MLDIHLLYSRGQQRVKKQVKNTAEERGKCWLDVTVIGVDRYANRWLVCTHPPWQMWIKSDWSDCQLCVPLSALSLAVPPLASSWVCRHSISASLEARSCCSSAISACGGRQSTRLWTFTLPGQWMSKKCKEFVSEATWLNKKQDYFSHVYWLMGGLLIFEFWEWFTLWCLMAPVKATSHKKRGVNSCHIVQVVIFVDNASASLEDTDLHSEKTNQLLNKSITSQMSV